MKLLILASSGGDAHRRTLAALIAIDSREHDVRVLAPDAEGKLLRPLGVPVESWKPSGLFSVLRSIGALQRAVEHHAPDVIHTVGWTASAVALGALTPAHAARTIVTLPDPIYENEMPKRFVEKRLPELLQRAARVACAYASLARMLIDRFGVARELIEVIPPAVAPLLAAERAPALEPQYPPASSAPRADGPIVGYFSPLEHDDGWQSAVAALAYVARALPGARLRLRAGASQRGAVRAFARGLGVEREIECADETAPAAADFLAAVHLLLVPRGRDGLPYALPQALVDGIPVVAANEGGLADTLAPFATGWLVPGDAAGLAAGIEAAWADFGAARAGALAQRAAAAAVFDPAMVSARISALYGAVAGLSADETRDGSQQNASDVG